MIRPPKRSVLAGLFHESTNELRTTLVDPFVISGKVCFSPPPPARAAFMSRGDDGI